MAFELRKVNFSYPGRTVFHDLSIRMESGRFHGIIGPNGCGKTTLLDLMAGLRRCDGGTIRYKEKKLSEYTRKMLAREIALVPQEFNIHFPFTAHEVVLMGRYPHLPRFSAPSTEDLESVDDIMALTDTVNFKTRRITELSGGERQRVVFARALAQTPRVLLLDEATANLDINHTLKLLSLAARRVRHQGTTVMAVFQDINLAAAFCDRLILMAQGRIHAHGDTAEVLTSAFLDPVFQVDSKIYFESFINANQAVFRQKGDGQ